ncbi:exonuclease 3'-5' domain-containing protein 2 isoform 1-T1 [Synchiropus picturatus]
MSHRGHFTAVLSTVLGATLGGLLIWKAYRSKRKKLPSNHTAADPLPAPCLITSANNCCAKLPDLPEKSLLPEERETSPPSVHIPTCEQLLGVKPVVVRSEEEWQQLWSLMEQELSVFPVLGLDCEWVSERGQASAVSLMQLASYSGLCVLVRLLEFHNKQQQVPLTLMEVLRDPRVLKVGVGCYEDGSRLTRDYGLSISCTVDLRYLALRQQLATLDNGLSLKSLASELLSVSLDKSSELRCSNWEAEQLSLDQMTYAAQDAQVSVALFFHLLGLGSKVSGCSYSELAGSCQGLVDVPFRAQGARRRRRSRRAASLGSPESGDQQVPDPRKHSNRRKPLGEGFSASRKSPLYDNCFLLAPDGQPLCTCDKKKAKWYLDKGIGALESEDPFVVRLLFEPSGRPESEQCYYLTAKDNLCVVCGKADSHIRKNIVPHEYRRHFPTEMKDHNSHDILLLCTSCHAASNVHDSFLKQRLAQQFSAPQGCEEGLRLLEDSDRRRVRSAARALLNSGVELPQQRREELQEVIKSYMNMKEEQALSVTQLQEVANLETRILNESYVPHGLKVVQAHAKHGLRGLMDLERCWRQHFLTNMKPKFLPHLWSVDHNHSKFLRKYGGDLPITLN